MVCASFFVEPSHVMGQADSAPSPHPYVPHVRLFHFFFVFFFTMGGAKGFRRPLSRRGPDVRLLDYIHENWNRLSFIHSQTLDPRNHGLRLNH